MSPDYILDVNELSFEYEVIAYSQNIPVLVDFWAVWCKPCKTLDPLLEKITREEHGSIRLAKLNVDDNPNLALQYSVRSIPTVKAFVSGKVVSEFVGLLPENRIRQFVDNIVPPSSVNLTLEKGNSLLTDKAWEEAEPIFRDLIEQTPDHPEYILGLAKSLLGQGLAEESNFLLLTFPASPQYVTAESLRPYAKAILDFQNDNLPDNTDQDATFRNSIRLARKNNFLMALDGLMDILRQDKHAYEDQVRLIVLAILELMGADDPHTSRYRSELASILF